MAKRKTLKQRQESAEQAFELARALYNKARDLEIEAMLQASDIKPRKRQHKTDGVIIKM